MVFNDTGNNANGGSSFPFFGLSNFDSKTLKETHDTYDIYVNNEFVGKKILLTQSENVNDVIGFLKKQGIQDVTATVNGDHYVIQSDDLEHVKQVLERYLQND
ncbi:hypothetical protein [Halalkalibacter alkalisediminis]|uniref:Uncharacterized protein n=1 Tax=Halalkalibacter alkalisediminis TaxID=935616 RepID=A0ABV6NKL5_9BACI|nr:hypothetical protein [Halalkalibacter alkalisediminis]